MDAKHTPGPFAVAEGSVAGLAARVSDSRGNVVATVYYVPDAYLFAAAPDGLAFAREVVTWLEQCADEDDEGAQELRRMGLEFIAKAEGSR